MTRLAELHKAWSEDLEYRTEYYRLGPEFALARALIEARTRARLTQAELAARMAMTQSVVARLESGRVSPSTRTLGKVARAIGTGFESTSTRHESMLHAPFWHTDDSVLDISCGVSVTCGCSIMNSV